jgi:signal transduction histidine kinase/DNA-binding response OmpR family regulator
VDPLPNDLRVLLIEDNDEHAAIVSRHLRHVADRTIHLSRASRLADGLAQLASDRFDALLLDLQLPDSDIDSTLHRTLPHALHLPIVVLSTLEERLVATRALKEGAQDYLCKADLSAELLIRAMHHAIERKHTEKRIREEGSRKQALYDLSQHALSEKKASCLLQQAVATLSHALHVELVKIMEFLAEDGAFLFRAGIGWKSTLMGEGVISAEVNALPGFTIKASRPTIPGNLLTLEPVIIDDVTTDARFSAAQCVRDHGAASGISVVIHGKDPEHPYGVLVVYSKNRRSFTRDEAQFLQGAANVLAAALLRIQLEEDLVRFASDVRRVNVELEERVSERTSELEDSQSRLRALATELNLAEHRERKRIASDLHDHLAQMLVLAKLKVVQAKSKSSLDSPLAKLLAQAEEALSQSLSYTRTLVADLSPSVLYESGLPAAITWLAQQMQRYDLRVGLEVCAQCAIALPEEQAVLVFQSVRELLMNVAKHAQSPRADLILECRDNILRVKVRDYGVGFKIEGIDKTGLSPKFGLFSIQERMKALGGSFLLQSEEGKGTLATLSLRMRS